MDLKDFSTQVDQIQKIFNQKKWTLGFAESCTGGLLSASIVAREGVSSFFKGGVVSYAGSTKVSMLNVDAKLIEKYGEVSLPVVKAMALGGKARLEVDWCLSVSGIAGPSGGRPGKPVGLVCFGLAGPGFEETHEKLFSSAEGPFQREDIQRQSVIFAFDFVLSAVR